MRSIINVDAVVNNASLPELSIQQEQIDLAALSGITAWPAIEPWAVSPAGTGFKDYLSTNTHERTSGVVSATSFVTAIDGAPAYNIAADGNEINTGDVDFSGGFTIALLCGSGMGIGSRSINSGLWFLASNELKLRWEINSTGFSSYTLYDGPLLSTTEMNKVVFVYDPTTGKAFVRVNGQKCLEKVIAVNTDALSELTIGAINVGTKQMRLGHYRAAVAFNRPLGDAGLAAVEAYLDSLKA